MTKIDKRRSYYMVLDTETANGRTDENGKLDLSDSLVYDCSFAIVDKHGRVYESFSYIVADIFFDYDDLMQSAYYSEKIPQYYDGIYDGSNMVITFTTLKFRIKEVCEKWGVKAIIAHNARFDYNALNKTERYLTKSKYRYFLPYGIEIWDTQKMAHDTICKQKSYRDWCEKHGYMTNHKTPRPRETAEILYRYISGNNDFIESHTGLEDVMIEKEIFAHCVRQHKPMRKALFEK